VLLFPGINNVISPAQIWILHYSIYILASNYFTEYPKPDLLFFTILASYLSGWFCVSFIKFKNNRKIKYRKTSNNYILSFLTLIFLFCCSLKILMAINIQNTFDFKNTDAFRIAVKENTALPFQFFAGLSAVLSLLGNLCLCQIFINNAKIKFFGLICLISWIVTDIISGNRESIKGIVFCTLMLLFNLKDSVFKKLTYASVLGSLAFLFFTIIGNIRNHYHDIWGGLISSFHNLYGNLAALILRANEKWDKSQFQHDPEIVFDGILINTGSDLEKKYYLGGFFILFLYGMASKVLFEKAKSFYSNGKPLTQFFLITLITNSILGVRGTSIVTVTNLLSLLILFCIILKTQEKKEHVI